ncbi:MAG: PA2779 family protein [Nitrospirae bacterium]|nr:PA2779 family protein [Nitrospirota bacterium]
MRIPLMRHISWYLVITMFIISIAPRVDAGLSPSEIISLQQLDREADLEKIQKVLEMKMVRERLEAFGFTKEEIKQKFDQLSDQQIHQLALQLDDIRVGKGDALGVIVILLFIAILVVLLLQATGKRVVITG